MDGALIKKDSELTPAEKFAKYARKPRGGRPKGSRDKAKVVAAERILALRKSGLTYTDVASITGVSESHVRVICDKHKDLLEDTAEYSQHKADILEAVQRKIVLSIDDRLVRGAPFRDRVQAVAALEGLIRKERGLDNKSIVNIFALTVKGAYEKKMSDVTDRVTVEVVDE